MWYLCLRAQECTGLQVKVIYTEYSTEWAAVQCLPCSSTIYLYMDIVYQYRLSKSYCKYIKFEAVVFEIGITCSMVMSQSHR